jgi:hypothetical protein
MNKAEAFLPYLEAILLVLIGVMASIRVLVYTWIWVPVIAILLLRYFEVRRSVSERHERVAAQLKQIVQTYLSKISGIRATYYVPVWRKELQQTCDYIFTGGGKGRRFSQVKGIIGKCYREKEIEIVNFSSAEDFRERMMKDFGYTEDEIKKRTPDRRSYYCYPFFDERKMNVIGLAYFDSSQYNVFTNDPGNIVETINSACDIISQGLL